MIIKRRTTQSKMSGKGLAFALAQLSLNFISFSIALRTQFQVCLSKSTHQRWMKAEKLLEISAGQQRTALCHGAVMQI